MDDVSGSSMVALLPQSSEWCRIECPHLTLVYSGEIADLKPTTFNELAKDASSIAMLSRVITLRVTGLDTFGEDDNKVDVLRLHPSSELLAMRRIVEGWNASEYPDYKPHVTIGPIGSSYSLERLPEYITFDRVMVGWGDEQLTFRLKTDL